VTEKLWLKCDYSTALALLQPSPPEHFTQQPLQELATVYFEKRFPPFDKSISHGSCPDRTSLPYRR
jgi:hypothetical protein